MFRIAVLVSGGGTNLQCLIDREKEGQLPGVKIACVLSSRRDAFAMKRAESAGIPAILLRPRDFENMDQWDIALAECLKGYQIDLLVLAGFLSQVGPQVLKLWHGRVINIHPSLMPKHCGPSYYGLKPHSEVLEARESLTGATVHFVDELYDHGRILLQKLVRVETDDTPEILQARVMTQAEQTILPQAVLKCAEIQRMQKRGMC